MRLEIKKCIDRNEFKIVFLIIYSLALCSFIFEAVIFKGMDLNLVRSAADLNMISGINSFLFVLVLVMPIMTSIIYADSYISEKNSGVFKYIITRIEVKKYLLKKAIVIFFINCMCLLIPICINILLCKLTFPSIGYDNHYGLPQYALTMSYSSDLLLDNVRMENVNMYNWIYAFNISIFAGLLGIISFGIFFLSKKQKYMTIISIYLTYVISEIAFGILNLKKFALSSYMMPMRYGNTTYMIGIILFLFILAVGLILLGINKEAKDIGI